MLYSRPNLKYTDMCKYIDDTVYKEDLSEVEEQQIFEYLYHICMMLAYKGKFFNNTSYYEDFSVYLASSIFMRLRNPKQFETDENGEYKLKRIKSVLNYAKKICYPKKVDFEQDHYCQSIEDEEVSTIHSEYTLADKMADSIDKLSVIDFDACLCDVVKTSRAFLKDIPYKTDPVEWHNIYLSCILTFLNSVTLPENKLNRLKRATSESFDSLFEQFYQEECTDSVILHHLDPSMKGYIHVLTKRLKHAIAKDLSLMTHTYISAESGFKPLILSDMNIGGTIEDR